MSRITIHEIARLAGVSIGTVSRALNNRPGISRETRDNILDLVHRMGYVPDAGARRLAQGRQQLIGVAPFSEITVRSPYHSYLLDAIQETVYRKGYVARVLEPQIDEPAFRDFAGFILPGLLLDDVRLPNLLKSKLPTVVINRVNGAAWLDIDNAGGMRQVVQHLVQLGHREIIHLTGSPISQTAQERLLAYQQTMHQAGLATTSSAILDGAFTDLGAYRAVRQAYEKGQRFSAIVSASDDMAVGAILALRDLGLQIPRDVSVTGFDDLPLARYADPPLTTVRQPIHEVGQTCAEILLTLIEGRKPKSVVFPTELVVRGSSGPVSD